MRKLSIGRERSRSGPRVAKRSRGDWLARGVLAVAALVLGYASFTHALANVIVKVDAQSAYTLAPQDGRIMAAYAWERFSAEPDPAPASQMSRLAARALLNDPTAVEAVNVLGLQAQLRSEDALADRVFGYSTALSRRELSPQIWAIETAVARGDVEGALRNYNVAMRTSRRARELLFPVLASAIAEPGIRAPLVEILADRSDWGERFIRYVPGRRGSDPRAVAALFDEAGGRGLSIADAERARAVSGLVSAGLMDEAWAYYRTFRPGVDRSRSRDPGFTLGSNTPAPFDWRTGNSTGLSVAILQDGEGGLLDFSVPSGIRASVVSQTQLLEPGSYRIQGRSSGIDQPERSRPYWALSCENGRELGRVDVPNSQEGDGAFIGQFTVPAQCPVQILSLIVRASDEISGVTGQVRSVQLVPSPQ